jgi:hypothetical protein
MTAKTTGQQLTAALRRLHHIGPRILRLRKERGYTRRQNIVDQAIETIVTAVSYPGYYTGQTHDALSSGYRAILGWSKHVGGYRLDPTQIAYLNSLTPWEFTALLGEMVDADINTTGDAERWFAARRAQDVAAWEAKNAEKSRRLAALLAGSSV